MSKAVFNGAKGQRFFEMYTALLHTHVASYTSCALPCLHIKQTAVKVISKVQQTLMLMG
jgi:hypothetical protein